MNMPKQKNNTGIDIKSAPAATPAVNAKTPVARNSEPVGKRASASAPASR